MITLAGRILVNYYNGHGGSPLTPSSTTRVWFYSDHTVEHYDSGTSPYASARVPYPQAWQIVGC